MSKRVTLQADLFLRVKLAQKHADLTDLGADAFYRRGLVQISTFKGQQFQSVIHNRSDAVDFSVVEAMRVLICHVHPFFASIALNLRGES